MIHEFMFQLSVRSPVSVVVISVAVMLFGGFIATRFTKLLKLPNVTAHILTGLGVYTIKATIVGKQLQFSSHAAIIDALGALDCVAYVEEIK